jgi:hypothetical protein
MRRSRGAVSAIIGGLIVLAILFTTIVPLVILLQNSYAIFLHESNSRRIFDTDRASESLSVDLIVTSFGLGKSLKLLLVNDGPITINAVRVWIIDTNNQAVLPCSGGGSSTSYISLANTVIGPGENKTIDEVNNCLTSPAFYNKIIQFLVVSERGRIFSSERINITSLLSEFVYPYTLTVSIINMKKGKDYTVEVEPLGEGDANPRTFTHKATASNENVTVAIGVTAGRYKVTLLENEVPPEDLSGNNPQIIMVPDTTAVIFNLKRVEYSPTPLEVIISAPKKVFVTQNEEEAFDVRIYVQLPKEALEPVEINYIDYETGIELSGLPPGRTGYVCDSYGSFTIYPGQREIAMSCTISVQGGAPGQEQLILTVKQGAIKGNGVYSGLTYSSTEDYQEITIIVRPKQKQ